MSDYLPHEVVTEILVRLPVKSLLQFRSVCRKWNSLISSPNFISQHAKSSPTTTHTLVRLCSQPDGGQTYSVYNNYIFTVEATTITFPLKSFLDFKIVGYSNGVLCLSDLCFCHETIILWNPSIRRAVNVPAPMVKIAGYNCFTFALGFGFDSVNNDYKIVRVAYLTHDCYKFPPKVEVSSASIGEWRLIECNVTFSIPKFSSARAVKDNLLHWIAYKVGTSGESKGRLLIVSFHLNTEIFTEMSLPKPLESIDPVYNNMLVAMFKDSFSVLYFDENSTVSTYAIWVMKEYGNTGSWVNQYNIDVHGGVVIGVLRNNALLVDAVNGELVSYNYEKKTSTATGLCAIFLSFITDMYVESLALVDKGREI